MLRLEKDGGLTLLCPFGVGHLKEPWDRPSPSSLDEMYLGDFV